jgi:hypothetical protein
MPTVRTTVRTAGRRALVAATAAAALLAGAGTAAAQEPRPGNWTYVVLVEGEGEDETGGTKGTLLRCSPPGDGGHPAAGDACEQLRAVDGDIARMKRADVACPMVHRPVTALSYGGWEGRRTAFAKTYPNECVLHASTGSVFRLG